MEVLSVKDLKFSYYLNETDTFHALQNITFSVEQGEMVLFCGLCGCGKTTLLKLLKEEIRPDGKMEGEIENRYGSMQTGYLFQNPEQQIVCRTVEEELVFGAENMDMPRDEMARSAAHAADIAKNVRGAREMDDKMADARRVLDWDAQWECAMDPETAKRIWNDRKPEHEDTCSMCGKFCAVRSMNKALAGEHIDIL